MSATGFELPPIVHASAVLSPWARLGRGAHALAMAVGNDGAEVGDDVIVNTGAIVEHDCRLGAHAHISPVYASQAWCASEKART